MNSLPLLGACRTMAALFAWAGWPAFAASPPPHLNDEARGDYQSYLAARDHRAFAIAPGGAWGWKADAATRDEAEQSALSLCGESTRQKCVLYSVDGASVFDQARWTQLWGPYADARQARAALGGRQVGERFPDIAFADSRGRRLRVSQLRGRVVVLHFWGSWCAPCRREMPDMQKLFERLKERRDIAFVLLQVREKFDISQKWAQSQGMRLPLFDSGSSGDLDDRFHLADGATLRDRDIAANFPTTYVIDKRGLVVFSHVGPVPDWSQYRDFLLDAARHSGR